MKACLAALGFAFACAFAFAFTFGLGSWGSSGLAWAAGQGDDGPQSDQAQWVRLTHEAFRDLFDEHPEGFTLRFYDDQDQEIAREFHAPDNSVYLDDYSLDYRSMGEIIYGEGEQFCYRYLGDTSPFCWHYFVSAQGYMEESVDGQIIDFFDIEPGNTFEQFWGRNWRSRFL